MTSIRAILAYNLKKHRKALDLSQDKLAEKVETSTHYISQIEQKHKFPSPEMLERLAAALEIDSPALFSMNSFSDEAIKDFQTAVITDLAAALETTVTQTVEARISKLKKTE